MLSIAVVEQSQISEARRRAVAVAEGVGFDQGEAGRAAIVATELATNLVRHAGGGEILVGPFEDGAGVGVEILALDKGPGMRDVQECLRDGFSTAGTPGNGLGAVMRQSAEMDIWSRPGQGTALLARLRPARPKSAPGIPSAMTSGVVVRAYPGEEACGDGWACVCDGPACTLMVADGLGHGVQAADAAQAAVRIFHKHPGQPPGALLQGMHAGLQATRGAAVAVARVDLAAGRVTYGGIGNIAGTLIAGGKVQKMVSHNGTAGLSARRIQEFTYSFTGEPLVVLHSDGLGSSWSLDTYPGLATRHPTLIAGLLYRDFYRVRDDVCVLAARGRP